MSKLPGKRQKKNRSMFEDVGAEMNGGRGGNEIQALSTVQLNASSRRLLELLGAERFVQLPELIDDIRSDTGDGAITIIIIDTQVVRLKSEKSY
jgi:hypothetical protein